MQIGRALHKDLTAQSLGIQRESLWKKLRELRLRTTDSDGDS